MMSFKTLKTIPPAQITAGPVTDVSRYSATAHGLARAGASDLEDIECLVSESSDMSSPTRYDATPASVEATNFSEVSCDMAGLTLATDYYVTFIGTDEGGLVDSGTPVEFTTLAPPTPILPPMVDVAPASNVEQSTAKGNGTVSTMGSSLRDIKCLYAREGENDFQQVDATPGRVDSPSSEEPVSCGMTGLAANTKYEYVFVGLDDDDEVDVSEVESFTTKAAPKPGPKPVVKQKQQLRAGAMPKKVKARGVTVVNKQNAKTRQGLAVTAKVSKVKTKCGAVVKGKIPSIEGCQDLPGEAPVVS